ncbi:DUF2742 domain-containing protein [Mycolicibacterium sp. 624]|uniref:DUF2742 domain-containing protein n=1 Tax=Mycolicibacterium sp. 624 TaxID=3156314 RepID=UPI0033935ADA
MSSQPSFEDAPADSGGGTPHSRQVNWFEVHSYAARLATSHGVALDHHLIPGTPQWCGMPDDDARKLLALVLGGVREALHHDVVQEHRAAASREISSAGGWSAVAQTVRNGRGNAYVPREVA